MNVSIPKAGLAAATLPLVFLTVGLFATLIIYYPGLSGPFFFDDFFNIQNNPNLRLSGLDLSALQLAAFSTESGPLQRPLSMVSFALNYYFLGESTTAFKTINLSIHLTNGVLIFLLARLLLRLKMRRSDLAPTNIQTDIAAALVAAVWLVHPLNLTTMLYVVQRMASLSALFVLLALLSYTKGRLLLPAKRISGIALLAASTLFWLCGLASKENALLLPWYIFLIEWLFLYPLQWPQPPGTKVRVYTFAWLFVPLVCGLAYLALHPGMLNHDFRPFTLWERVLTEIRALWFYAGLILLPRPMALGIFHDDFPLSTGLFTPWTTLPAILGLLLAVGWAVRSHRRLPLLAFGILFFLVAHALESSIFPLEIMHEHRNYLAMFGLLFGGIASLILADGSRWNLQLKARVLLVGVFFVFLGAITLGRATNWQDLSRLTLSQVDRHPESPASNYETGRLYIHLREQSKDVLQQDEFNASAIQYFAKAAALSPHDAAGPLAVLLINATAATDIDSLAVKDAITRLRHGLPNDTTINLLLTLSRCERQGECRLPDGQSDGLFQALLVNPRLRRLERATLLDEMVFRAIQAERFAEAEALFKEILALNAINAMYRINYTSFLIRLNRLDEARQQIERVLASPQPAAIAKIAQAFKNHIEQGPQQETPAETKVSKSQNANFSLQKLFKPREEQPMIDFGRGHSSLGPQ